MKLNAGLAKSLLMAASMGLVVPVLAQTPRPGGSAKAAPKSADEEEGVVDGIAIKRTNGRWLGVTIDGVNLRVAFYNDKKQPEPADVARGMARWRMPTVAQQQRAVLNRAPDGVSLVATHPIRKPWTFQLTVVLVNDRDEAVETYQVQLSDKAAPAPKS